MGTVSSLDRHLSSAEQDSLAAFFDEHPHISTDEVRRLLAERGVDVSRSTAHRYKQRLDEVGRRLRQSRSAMDALAAGLEDKDDSKRSRALLEMARTIIFEFQQGLLEQDGDLDPKDVARLGRLLKDVMMAGRYNQDFAEKERELRAELDRQLAAAEEDVAQGGDPMEQIRRIRRDVYGIPDD